MKKTCTWLIAMSCLLAVAGTTYAGAPGMTLLLLPQLFGQEPPRDLPTQTTGGRSYNNTPRSNPPAVVPSAGDDDEDLFIDFVDEGVNLLVGRACAQWVSQILRPYPPCNLVLDAVAGYFAVLDMKDAAASMAAANTNGAIGTGAAAGQPARNPAAGTTPPPATAQTGTFRIGAGFNTNNGLTSNLALVGCPRSTPADACTNDGCCKAAAKAAVKACRCCEDCDDCNDCDCGNKTARGGLCIPGNPVTQSGRVSSGYAIQLHPMPMAMQMALPGCGPELLHHPQVVQLGQCPVTQQQLHDVPLYPVEALQELIQERQAITHAIEQIERELMQMAIAKQQQQQQVSIMQAAHNAQKIHMATEFFEAHCDSLRCAGENVMVLEGDVRLTAKKGGHPIRIEAARVSVNMKDGTFKVESAAAVAMPVATPMQLERVHMMPAPPWAAPMPVYEPLDYPPVGAPVPPSWKQTPYRTTPPAVPPAPRPGLDHSIQFKY
jgi:hypothetical protein